MFNCSYSTSLLLHIWHNFTIYPAKFYLGILQIDNQLFGSQIPVAVFASPLKTKLNSAKDSDLKIFLRVETVAEYELTIVKVIF